MSAGVQLLALRLEGQRYGLPLASVERVVRSVEITPLPKAPEIVLGVINVRGRVIAVVDVRKRFRLPQRETALSDSLVIARTPARAVALLADAVTGVVECAENEAVPAPAIVPGMEYVEGVAKLGDGMVLIHDLARFLSLDEERRLDEAIAHA
ncbi:MAG: purine-binding chemotaxis protein CheW [Betaproteobacteria bacterium]|nr:MAG: purine-binding chemotaxis protein CheW [Betaproteobacteria bacterium]